MTKIEQIAKEAAVNIWDMSESPDDAYNRILSAIQEANRERDAEVIRLRMEITQFIADTRAKLSAAESEVGKIFKHCRVVYWPVCSYPIEHNLAAQKNMESQIRTALRAIKGEG